MLYFNLVDIGRTINGPQLREPTVTDGMEHGNGHRDGDTTNHYSAPELAELMAAAESVCRGRSGKTPALVIVKRRMGSARG